MPALDFEAHVRTRLEAKPEKARGEKFVAARYPEGFQSTHAPARRIRQRVRFVDQQQIAPLARSNVREVTTIDAPHRQPHVDARALRHFRKQSFSRAGTSRYDDDRRLQPDLPDDFAQ